MKAVLTRVKAAFDIKETGHHENVMSCILAGAEGLEPSARGFGDRCSTN